MPTNDAPGPDAYHVDAARRQVESSVKNTSKFGRDKKGFWLDNNLNKGTPGPIYRPSKHFTSK